MLVFLLQCLENNNNKKNDNDNNKLRAARNTIWHINVWCMNVMNTKSEMQKKQTYAHTFSVSLCSVKIWREVLICSQGGTKKKQISLIVEMTIWHLRIS